MVIPEQAHTLLFELVELNAEMKKIEAENSVLVAECNRTSRRLGELDENRHAKRKELIELLEKVNEPRR